MNEDKSFFIAAPNTSANRINRIRQTSSFTDKEFSFNYLEYPIYRGRKRISLFDSLLSKVIKRLNGWQGKMLYYGGEMILIKRVLQSLPFISGLLWTLLKALSISFKSISLNFFGALLRVTRFTIGVLEKKKLLP